MDSFEQKTLKTKRSFTYTYYVSPHGESSTSTPALFFIHGFPDSAHLWKDVVAQLSGLPNKIIIPDTLGYAGTDKPTDTAAYNQKGQADDLSEILIKEGAQSSIIIGHDWGSSISQRTYLHHPELFSAVILLNVAYLPPGEQPFDLDTVNQFTEKIYGYPQLAYWELFGAEDGAKIIDSNLESMWEVLHGQSEDWMKEMFCTKGRMKTYLTTNEHVPLKPYGEDPRWKDAFIKQFKRDGFDGPLRMYKAAIHNFHYESDKLIPKERLRIQVPVLFIGCTGDFVCRHDLIEIPKKAGLLPDLEEQSIESAHWVPMEQPGEVAKHIKNFLAKRFP
jgi:soluble epoxide hydrolase/lipid-phosphate phosphatase